jgi:ADP-heptose:LPS heptosyltransferase
MHEFVKFIDQHLFANFFYFLPKSPWQQPLLINSTGQYRSSLIIRPGGIGDAVLTLPLIRHLRKLSEKLYVIANQRNVGVFELFKKDKLIDDFYLLEAPHHWLRLRKKLDLVIDTEQWYALSGLATRLLSPTYSIGFDSDSRRRGCYKFLVSYNQERYEAQSFISLLAPISASTKWQDFALAELTLEPNMDRRGRKLIVAPGASRSERHLSQLNSLIKLLYSDFEEVLVVGTYNERHLLEATSQDIPNGVIKIDLKDISEIYKTFLAGSCYIGSDSGLSHLALLAGIRNALIILGPVNEKKWVPLHPTIKTYYSDIPCRPCGYGRFGTIPKCPYSLACLSNLPIEKLYQLYLAIRPVCVAT